MIVTVKMTVSWWQHCKLLSLSKWQSLDDSTVNYCHRQNGSLLMTALLIIVTIKMTISWWQHCKLLSLSSMFLFSSAFKINLQQMTALLAIDIISRSQTCTQLIWYGNFSCMQNFFTIKLIRNSQKSVEISQSYSHIYAATFFELQCIYG